MDKGESRSAGRMDPDFLRKVKDAVNIVDVVGEHVLLKKAGARMVGLCPFHSERSPSFGVSEQKQLYHCFGCKAGGDVIDFTKNLHGMSFAEAVEELAERARIPLPKDFGGGKGSRDAGAAAAEAEKKSTAYRLNRFAAAYFRKTLAQMPSAQEYFTKRGISTETQRNFYVGAAPEGWEGLVQHLVESKAPLPLAAELGLIQPSQAGKGRPGGPGYFDLFRNRVVFPILDLRGKVVAFGGRMLGEDKSSPKYLNSPESFIFHKSKTAFGLYQAAKHVREADEIILVEGYFDVVAMHQGGFQNVVATCGTALTVPHLKLFQRLASKITVLFDGDEAGQNAMTRAMEVGLSAGVVIYGATLPDGLDPDDLIRQSAYGVERMKLILSEARPLIDRHLEQAVREAREGGAEATTQSLKRVARWLGGFADPVGRDVRLGWIQKELGLDREVVLKALRAEAPQVRSGERGGAPSSDGPGRSGPQGAPNRAAQPGGRQGPGPGPVHGPGSGMGQRPQGPAPGTRPAGRPAKLKPLERTLIRALVRGSAHAHVFDRIGRNLSPEMTISDLFEHPGAQALVKKLGLERDFSALSRPGYAPERAIEELEFPEISTLVREALMSPDSPDEAEELGRLVDVIVGRVWARFSHKLKQALAEAESRKDAGLQAKLMKEYLDVQRKLKEFNGFYE